MPTEVITKSNYSDFLARLTSLADEKYRAFQTKLVPNEEASRILGVRMPALRTLAKEIGRGDPRGFLAVCGDDYYEERMLRALVTGKIKPESFEDLCALAGDMLPYVNNWAVCDCFCMDLKAVKRFREPFFDHIETYLDGDEWAQRVGLVLMLSYYLDGEYIDRVLRRVDRIHTDAYYVRMAQAWLLATAAAKCPEPTVAYFADNSLDSATLNKAIQKAAESFRVEDSVKTTLKSLKKR